MMIRVVATSLVIALAAGLAYADSFYVDTSAFATKSDASSSSPVLQGVYSVSNLPAASSNKAKYAFVSDLGGGADMVLSDGAYWKHIRQGIVTDVPGGGSITVTPLSSPPIMRLTGTNLASTQMTIVTTNLYPGSTYRILIPGALASLATFGVSVAGVSGTLSLVGASWQDVQWNGTALVKTAGGAL